MEKIPDLFVDRLDPLLNQITEFDINKDFTLIDDCKIKYKKLLINFIKQ